MTVWDFSKRGTRKQIQDRAALDALDAVQAFWPVGRKEPKVKMPGNLEDWADQLTIEFMAGTMTLPAWSEKDMEIRRRTEQMVMDAYYESCLESLIRHVTERIRTTHTVPRRTAPPTFSRIRRQVIREGT